MSGNLEIAAEHLWPGDRLRRGIRLLAVDHVAVTHDGPVVVSGCRVLPDGGSGPSEEITLRMGEIVRRDPGSAEPRRVAA